MRRETLTGTRQHHAPGRGRHPRMPPSRSTPAARPLDAAGSAARIWVRLTRRGAALLALAMAGYVVVEVVAFNAAYPDAASRVRMISIADNAAVRMLQGVPHAIETTGGYVVWDAGWMITSIAGMWAVLVTTRLLRAEEESDRMSLVLAGPTSACHAVRTQLFVLAGASLATGAAVTLALVAVGAAPSGSVLFGLGLGGFAATFVGVAAVLAQLFTTRRRAVAAATGALAASFVLRMVADSTPSRGALRWATPHGWVEELRAYDLDRWWALTPFVLAPVLLAAAAVWLRARRDTGAAVFAGNAHHSARFRFLGGPTGLAWRLNAGVLAGWLTGVAVYAFVIGSVASAVTSLTADDPNYRRLLEAMGMEIALTDRGFVSTMGSTIGLMLALNVCSRVAVARAEEAAGLADHVLTRPVTRGRWLGGHAGLALGGAVLLACIGGTATWLGAVVGHADVSLLDCVSAALATLPAVAVFVGVALLTFGAVPRLTAVVPAGLAVLAYLLQLLGPALDLPGWALGLSPFAQLAYVPAEPFAVGPAVLLGVVALAAGLGGAALFARRDVCAP